MKEAVLKINKTKISSSEVGTVMHKWETPLMKVKADFICQNGGDILEFGFGMGISASYIQKHNINSHTICEIHPQILENLYKWAEDKPNVIILEGDWFNNVDKMSKYDGILFDTHSDPHFFDFKKVIPQISNPNCRITWWNNNPQKIAPILGAKEARKTNWQTIEINPPKNTYFNHKQYYMPKYIYNHVAS